MKTDFVLELVLRDIQDNMDIQVDKLKVHNRELKKDLAFIKSQQQTDQWEQYLYMQDNTAYSRIYDKSCRMAAVEEYDRMVAEG